MAEHGIATQLQPQIFRNASSSQSVEGKGIAATN
jgi:hypothetical protein